MDQNITVRTFLTRADDIPLAVSRASVLTLWASVVGERLGYQRNTALTLGKAVAGTTARLKVRVIGRENWLDRHGEIGPALDLHLPRVQQKPATAKVVLLGKTIRLLSDPGGQLLAGLRTLPPRNGEPADEYAAADPAEVERYLIKTFGSHLAGVRTAMEGLAARLEPVALNRIGFQLYEKFWSSGPNDREGRTGKAVLRIANIEAALPRPSDQDNKAPGGNASLHRCFPGIAGTFSLQQLSYETNRVMAEYRQNIHRINESAAKIHVTAEALESAIADSHQLIAKSAEAMA